MLTYSWAVRLRKKLQALTVGFGKIPGVPAGEGGRKFWGLGGTPEKGHETCQ
mgnify:CR=1 FL=1